MAANTALSLAVKATASRHKAGLLGIIKRFIVVVSAAFLLLIVRDWANALCFDRLQGRDEILSNLLYGVWQMALDGKEFSQEHRGTRYDAAR